MTRRNLLTKGLLVLGVIFLPMPKFEEDDHFVGLNTDNVVFPDDAFIMYEWEIPTADR